MSRRGVLSFAPEPDPCVLEATACLMPLVVVGHTTADHTESSSCFVVEALKGLLLLVGGA